MLKQGESSSSKEFDPEENDQKPLATSTPATSMPATVASSSESGTLNEVSLKRSVASFPNSRSRRPSKKNKTTAVKRALSAYNIFFRDERARILQARQDGDLGEIGTTKAAELFSAMGKAIAKKWKGLTAQELEEYTQAAGDDMKRYRKEMDELHTKLAAPSNAGVADALKDSGCSGLVGRLGLHLGTTSGINNTVNCPTDDFSRMRRLMDASLATTGTNAATASQEEMMLQHLSANAAYNNRTALSSLMVSEDEQAQQASLLEMFRRREAMAGFANTGAPGFNSNEGRAETRGPSSIIMGASDMQANANIGFDVSPFFVSPSVTTLQALWRQQQLIQQQQQEHHQEVNHQQRFLPSRSHEQQQQQHRQIRLEEEQLRRHQVAMLKQELLFQNCREQELRDQQQQLLLLRGQQNLRQQQQELSNFIRMQPQQETGDVSASSQLFASQQLHESQRQLSGSEFLNGSFQSGASSTASPSGPADLNVQRSHVGNFSFSFSKINF